MSRIGKKPIAIPKGVKIDVQPSAVEVQGPKGKLRQVLPAGIGFELEGDQLQARTIDDDPQLGKFHGLARSLVANAVRGVTEGFRKDLDIVGIGYRAEVKGKQVVFALGYSHPVVFEIPTGHRHRHRQADAHHGDRRRSSAGRAGGREHPLAAEAGPVQAEGRPLHGRGAEEEGRKDGGRSQSSMKIVTKKDRRHRIALRQRKRIAGTAERPRLRVFRSVSHIYAQVIDDMSGTTIASVSSDGAGAQADARRSRPARQQGRRAGRSARRSPSG